MKKSFSLLAGIFIMFFLTIFISVALVRSNLQLRVVESRRASLEAFYRAEAGIERAVFELRRDTDWSGGEFNIGEEKSYSVEVYPVIIEGGRKQVWVRSIGESTNELLNTNVQRILLAKIELINPANFFISTLGDLRISSGAHIQGDLLGRDLIFSINYSAPLDGRYIRVEGDILYTRNLTIDEKYVSYEHKILTSPPVFTSVDLNRYREIAKSDGRYISGTFNYSGTINRANLESNNGVLFAEGDIHISGEVKESFLIVSGGNIYIDDNIVCSGSTQIGLLAKEDVIVPVSAPDNITIEAFIIADGGIFKAEKGDSAKNEFNFKGAVSVRGKLGVDTAISIMPAYSKRNYIYNGELVTNREIPFLPFMASILEWREVSATEPFPPEEES
ncbi:MAG: hypothetical protein NC904_08095 [Candidatus Omnitrophica bacterium]|nr:hypothetical protein [Candidatus Omnitrophota bacterium]